MIDKKDEFEKIVLTELMKMNAVISGVIFGLITGLGIFVVTIFLLIKGGEVVGPHLSLLGQFFIGYQVTFVGSIIGLLYGFGFGFLVGYLFEQCAYWFQPRAVRMFEICLGGRPCTLFTIIAI